MRTAGQWYIVPILTGALFLLAGNVWAADKVVVVPINSAKNNKTGYYVSVENSYTWESGPLTREVRAECPDNCIAVNGACSPKTRADATNLAVTASNFSKTKPDLPWFNAYSCWMLGYNPNSFGDPDVGYAQVVCSCH